MKKRPGRPSKRTEPPARITLSVDAKVKERLVTMSEAWDISMTRIIEMIVNEAWEQGKF